jgi:hypothetical protein
MPATLAYYEFNTDLSSIYGQSTLVPEQSVYLCSQTQIYVLSGMTCEKLKTAEENCEFLAIEKWKDDCYAILIAEKIGFEGGISYFIEIHACNTTSKVKLQFVPTFMRWIKQLDSLAVGSFDTNRVYHVDLENLEVSPACEAFRQPTLSFDFMHLMNGAEIRAIGCLDGYIELSVNKAEGNVRFDTSINGAASALHSFQHPKLGLCMLACSTFAFAVLYLDIIAHGFEKCIEIPDCFDCDAISCGTSFVEDERIYIVLGTFSQQILLYDVVSTDSAEVKLIRKIDAGDPVMNVSRYFVQGSSSIYLLVHLMKGVLIMDLSNQLTKESN